jgi:glycine/D-amino acid oxidase-like deaminating enzyme
MNIVVIGAGIVGANVAFRLAEGEAKVTVVEAGRVGDGTSARSFAWINAHRKTPRAYYDLNIGGMQAHLALRERFPQGGWWHGAGAVEWAGPGEDRDVFTDRVERLRDWGYAAEIIDLARLRQIEPDIDPAAVGEAPIGFFPDEGWVDPVLIAHTLLREAVRLGATLLTEQGPARLVIRGGRAVGVACAAGEIAADLVVNCTGCWSNSVTDEASLQVPLTPTSGMLVYTAPVAADLRTVVMGAQCQMHADGAGRIVVRQDHYDRTILADTPAEIARREADELVAIAAQVVPSIGKAKAEAVRIGVRALPADGKPAIGPIGGLPGYYVAVCHSGVTLAPFLGELIADEVIRGTQRGELAIFRPDRFHQANAPAPVAWRED